MLGSSGSGEPARSGTGPAAPGKGSRQVETGHSHGASQPASTATCTAGRGAGRAASGTESRQVEVGIGRGASWHAVASGGAAQPALRELVEEIIQLGHMPRQSKNTASAKERSLYFRLWRARTAGSLTKEQEAALDKLAQASVTNVVQQVRDLGHYPKASLGRSLAERQLAWKLRTVVIAKQFSPEQEAELQALRLVQQVRDLGRYPKGGARRSLAERQLAEKLRRALKAKQFSPEQEAELQALRHASPKQEEELMQQVSPRRAEELIQQVRNLGHPHNKRPSSRCSSKNRGMLAHKTGMQAQGFGVGLPPGTRRRIVA